MGHRARPSGPSRRRVVAILLAVVIVVTAGILARRHWSGPSPWRPEFGASGLVTNEWAYHHPDDPRARLSPDWRVTSGSLFSVDGEGTGGDVDGDAPGPYSTGATGSAVFRAVSRRRDFRDVRYSLDLFVAGMSTTHRTGEDGYDGVHLFLRYRSHNDLYAVSLCRRDDTTAIKKKASGGNGRPSYTTLGTAHLPCPRDTWSRFTVTARNTDRGVELRLADGDRTLLTVHDDGAGDSSPLSDAGAVGIRADNTRFRIRDVVARPL